MSNVNPFDNCGKNIGESCSNYQSCEAWKNQYFERQNRINAYAEKVLPAYYAQQEKEAANEN